jgi:hypothetical protein
MSYEYEPATPRLMAANSQSSRAADDLEALESELTNLAGHLNAGNYRFLMLLAEFDRRGGHVGMGIASCAHWLSWRCGIGLIAAREKVRVARALEQLPKVADAMRRGVLSYCKVRALTRVASPDNESVLLNVAEQGTVSHIEKLVRVYRRLNRADERGAANALYAERYLQAYVDHDGTVVIRARLAPEQGSQFMTALRAASDALRDAERDSRESFPTPDVPSDKQGARNADAIALIAEGFLTHGASPASGGDRQLITVHVDQAVLRHETADGCCLIDDHVSIPPTTARRMACDASLVTIVDEADGNPLDVDRKTRSIPKPLRRALHARDKQCQFPGCTNDRFVDAHHIQHWVDGGVTSLANLVLLCRRHHRFVHEYGYAVRQSAAGFEFVRPDGRAVPTAPPVAAIEATRGCEKLCEAHQKARVDIQPSTADSHWTGENLDYDWTLQRLFELDEQARRESEREASEVELE